MHISSEYWVDILPIGHVINDARTKHATVRKIKSIPPQCNRHMANLSTLLEHYICLINGHHYYYCYYHSPIHYTISCNKTFWTLLMWGGPIWIRSQASVNMCNSSCQSLRLTFCTKSSSVGGLQLLLKFVCIPYVDMAARV